MKELEEVRLGYWFDYLEEKYDNPFIDVDWVQISADNPGNTLENPLDEVEDGWTRLRLDWELSYEAVSQLDDPENTAAPVMWAQTCVDCADLIVNGNSETDDPLLGQTDGEKKLGLRFSDAEIKVVEGRYSDIDKISTRRYAVFFDVRMIK